MITCQDKVPLGIFKISRCLAVSSLFVAVLTPASALPLTPQSLDNPSDLLLAATVPLKKPGQTARGPLQSAAGGHHSIQTARNDTPLPLPKPSGADLVTPPTARTDAGTGPELAYAPADDRQRSGLPGYVSGDPKKLRAALTAVQDRQIARAISLRRSMSDPIDRRIVDWLLARTRDPAVTSDFIKQFRRDLAHWPSQDLLQRRTEQALYRERPPARTVIAAFRDQPPKSTAGALLLAAAYRDEGKTRQARDVISRLWRTERLSASEERQVLAQFKSLLKREDHRVRAHMLLYDDRARGALRVASYLSSDQRKLINAWIAVIRKNRKANALLKAVPKSQRAQPGYVFARIKQARRARDEDLAIKLMLNAPTKASALIDPDEWWVQRRIVSRMALDQNRPRDAYKIASVHSAKSPARYAEGEFHAGWYALRFLNDPARARGHFANIEKVGKTPITRSRAFYWLGRSAEAAGKRSEARSYYRQAAQYKSAFYGQLAQEKLGSNRLGLGNVPKPSRRDREAFTKNELVIAIRRLEAAGFGQYTVQFYRTLAKSLTNPGELALVIQLAQTHERHSHALMVGKLAVSSGVDAHLLAFPVEAIPAKAKIGRDVGKPIVYAIARQESAFNPRAISPAGARGLLQLMPATARATARQVGLGYSKSRLTSDPAYNTTLGAAHLGVLLDEFNGSYILTFAAYNAGGSRSHKWMKKYGDPRTDAVDVVDWIERIPFTETRNYVQRIMENLVMYRARFERDRLQITQDLKKG